MWWLFCGSQEGSGVYKCEVPTPPSAALLSLMISFGGMLCSFEKEKELNSTELGQPLHCVEKQSLVKLCVYSKLLCKGALGWC